MWISVGSRSLLTAMKKEITSPAGAVYSPVVTVSELLRSVRDTLERRFPLLWVRGELSNLSRAPSGHCYFTLKDRGAQVDCVMYRTRAAAFQTELRDGMQIEAQVLVTLYEPRGRFQLTVESLRPAGLGPLYERFLRLKEKLEREGLFDPAAKRSLPAYPRTIGVITSRAAASIEDLWSFNEERVARAIRACAIPVIVGVGHETDFTIADFAADRRAPTPTAAAELATPARAELAGRVADCVRCLAREMRRRLQYAAQALDGCTKRLVHPAERLRRSEQTLAQLRTRLALALGHRLHRSSARLERLQASLTSLDPYAVLARGYSITRTSAGAVLRD